MTYPIFGNTGNYPQMILNDIAVNSRKEGRWRPRLMAITSSWSSIINGSADFLGLNYYTSRYVEEAITPIGKIPSWQYDSRLKFSINTKWKRAKSSWLYSVAEGLEDLLK